MRFWPNGQRFGAFNHYYYMANPVLGKSLCSDWFFLGQDFAVQSNPCIFVLEQSRQIQHL